MGTCKTRTQGPNRRYLRGTDQRSSESQVSEREISKNYSERARNFPHTWEKRRSGAYIVANSKPRSLESGDFSLKGRSGIRVFEIVGCLSIWGRYGCIMGSLCMIRKMFPYMSIVKDPLP